MKTKLFLGGFAAIAVILGEVWLLAAPQAEEQHRSSPPQVRQVIPAHSSATAAISIAPTVGAPNATPSLITVNTPTTVTVTVQISPAPLAGGVNLLRLGATGTQSTVLGVMHDDGENGDAVAGDGIYTLQVSFREAVAGQIQLEVSAAFKGILKRSLSSVTALAVWPRYASSSAPVSFNYPAIPNVNLYVSSDSEGALTLDVTTAGGIIAPVLYISVDDASGYSSISDWFSQNVDNSGELLISTYTLGQFQDGRSVLTLTGSIPIDWDGGPLAQAYVMAPNLSEVATIEMSQADALGDYGFSSRQVLSIVDELANTVQFQQQ